MLLSFYTNILVNLVINRYYQNCRCLLIFTDTDLDYEGDIPAIKLKMINDTITDYQIIFNYYGCQDFEKRIRVGMERFNSRRFLIIPRKDTAYFEEEFFGLKELEFVCDVLVILPQKTSSKKIRSLYTNSTEEIVFILKTHSYVHSESNTTPILIDKWFSKNQTFFFGRSLYPDKISNQLGRPLKMATFPYAPYSIIGPTIEEYYGSEMVSAVQFALKLNMTPVPVVNDKDYWGEIFPNWSGNGLLGNIALDNADIGFGALYTWEYCYHYLDLSKPLVRTGITCLVPAPKLAARWLTPLFSYSPKMWIYVCIVLIVGTIVLSFILICYHNNKIMKIKYLTRRNSKYYKLVSIASTTVMKPVLSQALAKTEIPTEISSKFMIGLMLIVSLFLTSTYSSGLATVMTLPRYEGAINTVEEFAHSGLDWGATQNAWITSIQNAKEPNYVKIVSRFHPLPETELREHSKSEKWAFSIERLPFENFAIGDYIKEDVISNFHLMQQDLYWEHCVIMLRKNSVLLPVLDLFILTIFEAGLISRWQNKAVTLYMDGNVQKVVKYYSHHKHQEHDVVKLNWSHVEGPFAILTIGYSISIVVFIVEMIAYWKKHKIW